MVYFSSSFSSVMLKVTRFVNIRIQPFSLFYYILYDILYDILTDFTPLEFHSGGFLMCKLKIR